MSKPERHKRHRDGMSLLSTDALFKKDGSIDWRQLISKMVVAICAFMLIYVIGMYLLRDKYAIIGQWVETHLGFGWIFLFVFMVDMLIVPMSVDLIFPLVMELDPVKLLAVMGFASILGGYGGYWIGRLLGKIPLIRKFTDGFSQRGEQLFRRYGVWAIVIAGLTPIPYSTVCWIAGMLKTPPLWTFLACFSRIPRMILYYLLFKAGLMVIF